MATANLAGRMPPGNPTDILDLLEAGLRVMPRPDLTAIEIQARAAGEPPVVILLAPVQAVDLAGRLINAALDVAAAVDREGQL